MAPAPHAHPAVAGLPDKVRHQQQPSDRNREREPPGVEDVPPPDKERRDQEDEDDREQVLGLEPDPRGVWGALIRFPLGSARTGCRVVGRSR